MFFLYGVRFERKYSLGLTLLYKLGHCVSDLALSKMNRKSSNAQKILIVSKCATHITRAGNQFVILAQAEILKELGNEVHFLYVQELPLRKNKGSYIENEKATAAYWGNNYHLYQVPVLEKAKFNIVERLREKFAHNYRKVDDGYPCGLSSFVQKLQDKYHFDICIVNYTYLSKLFTKVNFSKMALFTHDCFAYRALRINEPTWSITAAEEAKGLQRATVLFAIQDVEATYFKIVSPKSKIYTIYSRYKFRPQPIVGNHKIMFLSGNNGLNQKGLRWFIRDVFSLIRHRFADAQLIVGGGICEVIKDLENEQGIKLAGFVDDVAEFFAQGDVAINPVYQGTGLKIKTFESLSYDKVTMVHPHSMEGVYKAAAAPLFASANPQDWVEFLANVWGNKDRIAEIKSENAKYMEDMEHFVVEQYKQFLKD